MGVSKRELAQSIFDTNLKYGAMSRQEVIARFVTEAGLTKAGASTYYQQFKKASGPAPVNAPKKRTAKAQYPNVKEYVDNKNMWSSVFKGHTKIAMPKDFNGTKSIFGMVACDFSPENISCDGEAPASVVKKEFNRLTKVWSELEQIAGRRVSQAEAAQW